MVLQSFCDRYPVQHRKSNSPVSLLRICVDLRLILSWSSAAHAAPSFNVTHGPASSPQARRNGHKRAEAKHMVPLQPLLMVSTSHTDLHLFICPCRTALPCSSVPTSWTRKTSSASQILSWSSTEVTRMERESSALLSFS